MANTSEFINVSTTVSASEATFVKQGLSRTLSLRIPKSYSLSRYYVTETDQRLILTYQYDNFDSGSSQILFIDKAQLKLLKRKVIGSFNIVEPLINSGKVFVAAAGYVAEFDLSSGNEVWEFTNLFGRPHNFNGLIENERIELQGDIVRFGSTLSVNRQTQQILTESSQ